MGRFVERIPSLALALGAPGLLLVCLLDSSFLSLPEAPDLLLIWLVIQHKGRMALYAATAVAGSVAGCLALYGVGRKGGDALVRSRFNSASVDRALGSIQRYGVMAVLIPSLLPPPAPFKIFVILAGIAGISAARFALAIVIGRALRYFGEGVLAVLYGDRALDYIHANGKTVSLASIGVLLVGAAGYALWTRTHGRRRADQLE
jgi:membrane protein YqaA with SNARE-associated domain